jgi:hypothetical protein
MSITEIVKAVFKLKNVRRAPGNAGRQHRFTEIVNETETDYYIQRDGTVGAWPTSMHIVVCPFVYNPVVEFFSYGVCHSTMLKTLCKIFWAVLVVIVQRLP